jgi:2-polyprenyl-3-methyl-5-hydroxy-6-metoxy-1,4-benzoquinol methylase
MSITCPVKSGSTDACEWKSIPGKVKDAPNVGVRQCSDCGLITHAEDLNQLVDYQAGSMHDRNLDSDNSQETALIDLERRLKQLRNLSADFSLDIILDIGCSSGAMLTKMSDEFTVVGIEPDESARSEAISFGHTVYDSLESARASNVKSDAVTLFHVVEHLYDPQTLLKSIQEILNEDGLLIIETPNASDILSNQYGCLAFQNFTYWSHHPMIHSHNSLELMVEDCGYEVLENVGVQRYNLNNHLYWLAKGSPGGHEKWRDFVPQEVLMSYSKLLVEKQVSDTIWLVAKMKSQATS